MCKRIRRFTYLIGAVLGITLLLVAALFSTETGSSWLISRMASYWPKGITIGDVQGNFIAGLSLYEVRHNTNHLKMHFEHIMLDWRPLGLLRGNLHIYNLRMKGVSLFVPRSSETFPTVAAFLPEKITIPTQILLNNVKLEEIRIHQGENLYKIRHLNLSGRVDSNGIIFEKFNAYGKGTRLNFSGQTGLQEPYSFEGNIHFHLDGVAQGNRPIKGECYIEGDIQGVKATFKLALPFGLKTNFYIERNKEWTEFYVIGNRKKTEHSSPIETQYSASKTNLYLNQLLFHTLGGSVSLDGFINWQPKPVLDFSIHGENIDLGVLFPNVPSELEFTSRFQGRIKDEVIEVSLDIIKVFGHLFEIPFETSGSLTFQDNQPKKVGLNIQAGNNRLNLNNISEKSSDLQFNLEIMEPGSLWPGLGGQWRGKGSVKQLGSSPAGILFLEGKNVTYGNFYIEDYNGSFSYDTIRPEKFKARSKLTNLLVDGQIFQSLSIAWTGDLKRHLVRAELVSPTLRMNLEFMGECIADTWKFVIKKATCDLENGGTWNLDNLPVKLVMSHAEINPFRACWTREDVRVCADISWSANAGWNTVGDLDNIPINRMCEIFKVLIQRPKLDKRHYKSKDIQYQ